MSQLKIYKASAGSGKTYTLAKEYIKELLIRDSDESYRHILAVTFTKEATGEMKDRILAELYGLAFNTNDSQGFLDSVRTALREAGKHVDESFIREKARKVLDAILHDYSHLYITTIDSFFQKILRNLARELGKGSRFNLEMNTAQVRLDAVNQMIENAHQNPQLLQWLTTYVENKLEQDDNWHFKDEVYRFSASIYDEFFQEHEQLLHEQLDNNPAIFNRLKTHHQKLLREYKTFFQTTWKRVSDLLINNGLEPAEFIQKGTVFNFWKNLADNQKGEVNKTISKLMENAENWSSKTSKRRDEIIALAGNELCGILQETVSVWQKQNTSRLILSNIHQLGLVWYITNEINGMNLENNRFMLSDTALFLNRMIDNSDSPFIYEKIGAEIRHVMIDEFQDTSRLQWGNFKVLLSDILANDYFSMIVGDVKQSIYRWRNGDWRILNRVGDELRVQPEALDHNFRSEKRIVTFNNDFFVKAGEVLDRKFREELYELSDSPFALVYKQAEIFQKSNKKTDSGYVSIDFLQDGEKEKYKDAVLNRLLKKLGSLREAKIPASGICILVRNNSQIKVIAEYFSSVKPDFPELAAENYLNIVSNEAFQLDNSLAVNIIMQALKAVACPDNPVFPAQLEYLNVPFRAHCGGESQSTMPLAELISYFYRLYDLQKIEGQSAYLFSFFDAINQYLKNNSTDIHSFISFWDKELSKKTIPSGEGIDGVRAMTIHKSKGLQFHTVLLPYCTWELNPKKNPIVWCGPKEGYYDIELLPVNYSEKMEGTVFSEEYQTETSFSWMDNLNLLYVAFTRAERNLVVFGKYKKTLAGLEQVKNVSDLLQWTVSDLDGNWNSETLHFDFDVLEQKVDSTTEETDNLLKRKAPSQYVEFVSEAFPEGKSIFKQSNKSRDFVNPDVSPRRKYIEYGNVMHMLFAGIRTMDDIENAVDRLILDGIILPFEKENYVNKINDAIRKSGVEDWFSDKYKSYSEFSILLEENGEITTKRPDRVLLSETETIIIDYKFGKPQADHQKQMQQYVELLNGMGYPCVTGRIWYVEAGGHVLSGFV
ncbi:MAG: UvrD-helicase domain-containing protein [Dysgonamonadaceae bacterium]|jgi:ATP-dependent exoDNAse (exonuclease V) beta subunit|nr:UvrD-helicase domain-containing protein [Dysgonamonadaceae bacterium]